MPKRKVTDSLVPPDVEEESLAAIREARKHPHVLTAEEEREFLARWEKLPVVDETGTWADDCAWVITRRYTLALGDRQRVSELQARVDPKYRTLMLKRHGAWVYRERGKAGADLPVPPYYWRMLQQRRDFETEAAKVERRFAARRLYQPRRHKADEQARRIVALSNTVRGSSRLKRIARAAGCSVRTVERVLKNTTQRR